jgi:WD40 repeat protein
MKMRAMNAIGKRALLTLLLGLAGGVTEAATVNYEKQVFPFLKDNCLPCHNKTTTKGDLNMETVDLMLVGGENGTGLVKGEGAKSLIYQAAAGEYDSEMPPNGNKVGAVALSSGQLALLKQWIDEGAHHAGRQEKVIVWEPLPLGFRPIYATAMTADGQYAAAARGNQVTVYHLPTGRVMTRLTDAGLIKAGLYQKPGVAHRDVVPALAFSPGGDRLVTGSYREAKVWRRSPAAAIAPGKPVAASKFKLAAAGADGVKLLEAASGAVLRELQHGAAVTAFALSPDDQRVASAGADHKIKLWEAATGKLLREIVGDWDTDQALAKAVRGADRTNLEMTWWTSEIQKAEKEVADLDARLKKAQELAGTAKTGLETATKDKTAKQEANQKAAAALNEVVAQIKAASAGDAAAEADPAAKAESKAEADPAAAELAKKQEALQAAATKAAEELKVAEETLQRAKAAVEDAAKEIAQVTQMKAVGAEQVVKAKAELETAKKAQAEATAAKEKASQAISAAAAGLSQLVFSPDGTQLAGLNAQGQLRAWAVASGRALPGPGSIKWGLSWTDERGPQVSSGVLMDPARSEWNLERTLGTGDGQSPITDRVNALSFSSDGKLLAIGSGEPSRSGDVSIWQMPTGTMTARFDEVHLDSVLALAFSPDGKQLATGAADKVMKALDVATGKVLKVFEGHTHHVLGVAWRADGRMLASAGADNVLKVWDAATGERRQNVAGWDKEVTAVTYLGGGDSMATASGDAKLRLISSAGAEVKQLAGAADFVHALSLSGEGRWLVAGGQDGVLRLWDVASGQVAQTFGVE